MWCGLGCFWNMVTPWLLGLSHARGRMPDFRLPRRVASKVDFGAPRPKFVWPRREPLYACSDAAAYVPDDGGREPGTGVLRLVRGVRGPRDERHVSARGTGRARAQGWMGPRVLPERRARLAHAGCRLRGGRIEVLRDGLEDCEAQHRARGGTIAHRHGPPAARKRRRARGPEALASVHRGGGRGDLGVPAQMVARERPWRRRENRLPVDIRTPPRTLGGPRSRRGCEGDRGSARPGNPEIRRIHRPEFHALRRPLAPFLSGLPNERPILHALSRQFRSDDDRGFRAHSSDAIGTDAPWRAPHDYVRLGTPEDHRVVEGSSGSGSARGVAGVTPTTRSFLAESSWRLANSATSVRPNQEIPRCSARSACSRRSSCSGRGTGPRLQWDGPERGSRGAGCCRLPGCAPTAGTSVETRRTPKVGPGIVHGGRCGR